MNPMYLQEDHDWFISKAVITSHDTYGDLPVQTHKVGIGNSDRCLANFSWRISPPFTSLRFYDQLHI